MMGSSFLGNQKGLASSKWHNLLDNNALYFCNTVKQTCAMVTKRPAEGGHSFLSEELPLGEMYRTTSFSKCRCVC